MSEDDTNGPETPDASLTQAEEMWAAIERQSFEALTLFRRVHAAIDDVYDRGLAAQRVWEIERAFGDHRPYFSEAGQDRFLDDRVFRGRRDGVFVEVGGYDGVAGSNCLFFEAFRGWSGVVVEPLPALRDLIVERRRAPCIDVAVSDEDGVSEFVHVIDGYTQMSGLLSTYHEGVLDLVRSNPDHREGVLQVKTRRLSSILAERGLNRIDYCSLDIEGAEQSVLSTFPFDDFEITAWSVENGQRDPAIRSIMESNGYRMLTVIGVDEIYVAVSA